MDIETMSAMRAARRMGGSAWHNGRHFAPAARMPARVPSVTPLPVPDDSWVWDENGLITF